MEYCGCFLVLMYAWRPSGVELWRFVYGFVVIVVNSFFNSLQLFIFFSLVLFIFVINDEDALHSLHNAQQVSSVLPACLCR